MTFFLSRKLVVEIDGVPHEELQEYDSQRSADLEWLGFTVVRFWNGDLIHNMTGVLDRIYNELHKE